MHPLIPALVLWLLPSPLNRKEKQMPQSISPVFTDPRLSGVFVGLDSPIPQVKLSPKGVTVRGNFWREGPILYARAHIVAAGKASTIQAKVDLREVYEYLKRKGLITIEQEAAINGYRDARVGGFPGSIVKAATSAVKAIGSAGKAILNNKITQGIKTVVQSKYTAAAVGIAAIAFPPIGVPAAAAFTAANVTLSAIDKYKSMSDDVKKVVDAGGKLLSGPGGSDSPSRTAIAPVRETMRVSTAIKAAAKTAAELKQEEQLNQLAASGLDMQKLLALKAAKDEADKAKAALADIAAKSRAGDPEAKQGAAIIAEVYKFRQNASELGSPLRDVLPGLLVTNSGQILPGAWAKHVTTALVSGYRGNQAVKVGCMIGAFQIPKGLSRPAAKPVSRPVARAPSAPARETIKSVSRPISNVLARAVAARNAQSPTSPVPSKRRFDLASLSDLQKAKFSAMKEARKAENLAAMKAAVSESVQAQMQAQAQASSPAPMPSVAPQSSGEYNQAGGSANEEEYYEESYSEPTEEAPYYDGQEAGPVEEYSQNYYEDPSVEGRFGGATWGRV